MPGSGGSGVTSARGAFSSLAPEDRIWISRIHNLAWVKSCFPQVLEDRCWVYDIEALVTPREALRRRQEGLPYDLEHALSTEVSLFRDASRLVAASSLECQRLAGLGLPSVQRLAHPLEPRPTPRGFTDRADILFVGSFHEIERFSPNRDAVFALVREIWPRVSRELGCGLTIAGHNAMRLKDFNLEVTPDVHLVDGFDSGFDLYNHHRLEHCRIDWNRWKGIHTRDEV